MEQSVPTRSCLRPEVEILRTGPSTFMLYNPRTGARFTCGAEERYLLYLLEHTSVPEELQRAYERRFGPNLSQRRLLEFLEQLRRLDFLTEEPAPSAGATPFPDPPPAPAVPAASPGTASTPAPLTSADPGAALNRIFDYLVLLFGWLAHPLCLLPLLVLVGLAVTALVRHWGLCVASLQSPTHWVPALPLMIVLPLQTLVLLSLPHNLFYGIICRRHGGRIRSFGINLYDGLIPNFHCDIGDSFALLSDRGRWALLLTSVCSFLAVGSISILAWSMCRPGSVPAAFWIWMLPPCLGGVFCQSLPFFKGDMYWILCTHFKDVNLRERALAETRAWLNGRPSPEALSDDERYWLRLFGVSFYLFRLVFDTTVILVISYFVTKKFQGMGALVFGALVLYWYRAALGRLFMRNAAIAWLVRCGGPGWLRWPVRLLLAAAVVALGWLPYTNDVVGECRLLPQTQHGVRALLTAEIEAVYVSEGDVVPPGTVIAKLDDLSVREAYLATKAELEKAQANLDLLLAGYRSESVKIAEERVALAQVRLAYYSKQMQREESLVRTQASSQQRYDTVRRDFEAAQDQLLVAKEQLSKLQVGFRPEAIRAAEAAAKVQQERLNYYEERLKLTQVITPLGGRVVTPYMEQKRGQQAKAGDLIAVLQDTSHLLVEVSASETAGEDVRPGMPVNIRLTGTQGRLLTGKVVRVAFTAEPDRTIGAAPIRTDPEMYQEENLITRSRVSTDSSHVRVYVEVDGDISYLKPDMTGYARIIVDENDVLWHALVRPVARFLRTEVWSWLP